jgi:phage baseplate assembly protein V
MTPGSIPGIVIAKVVDNNDPESLGRVKLRFPWLDAEMVSDWVPVAQPHAGNDRGIFWMPEIEDEMVVGFLHGDFARPIVLGALWNQMSPPPAKDPRERMLRSKNGHTIRFLDSTVANGDKGALIIQDGHGSSMAFSNGFTIVKAVGTLVLEADTMVLRGKGWARTITPNTNPI